MKKMLFTWYRFFANRTPVPIKLILKFFGFHRFFSILTDKYTVELLFQTGWATEFKDKKHKVLEYWEKFRYLNVIKTIVEIHEDTKILDVGCGISTVLHFVNGKKYGIDPLAESYKSLYKYPGDIHIQKAEGEDIPFIEEFFDIVFCSNVIDHVSDPQKVIDNILRVLKKNGYFVLTVELFRKQNQRDLAHPRCLTKADIVKLLSNRFQRVFEKESPWIGLQRYVNGKEYNVNNELIIILQKI